MINYIKRGAPLAIAALLFAASCTESKTSTAEQTEIKSMDSSSRVIKENTEKLEEQTKKVEESLEKSEAAFETNN